MALAPDEFSNVNFAAQNIKIILEGKTSCLQVVRGGGDLIVLGHWSDSQEPDFRCHSMMMACHRSFLPCLDILCGTEKNINGL